MANRTMKYAHSVKGTNPQYLVEKIIRSRIYESKYWKEHCFALTAELLVDKALALDHIGGVYGGSIQPTPFICLAQKMLQIQPDKDIVIEFIKNEDYKYVRALGAFYMRLTGTATDCYKYLELLYNDYRKMKRKNRAGNFELLHVDEFVDELLHGERSCDIILPRIQNRHVLEETEQLEPRISALEDDLDIDSEEDEEEDHLEINHKRSPSPAERRHRDRDRGRDEKRRRYHSRSDSPRPHRRYYSRSPSPYHRRRRSRSRSAERKKHHNERHRRSHRYRDRSRSQSHSPQARRDRKGEKEEKRKKKKKAKDEEDEEIKQANQLRAKLGIKPLKN